MKIINLNPTESKNLLTLVPCRASVNQDVTSVLDLYFLQLFLESCILGRGNSCWIFSFSLTYAAHPVLLETFCTISMCISAPKK